MKRTQLSALVFLLSGMLCQSCGGSGGGGGQLIDPNSGRLSGELRIIGPYNPALQLRLRLLFGAEGSIVPLSDTPVGRVPGSSEAYFSGRAIQYTFSELFYGTYSLQVYGNAADGESVIYTSPQLLPGFNGAGNTFSTDISFTGGFPYGSAQGDVIYTGEWPQHPSIFLGFLKVGADDQLLRWPLRVQDASDGELPFTVGGLAIGWYEVGLYSIDSSGVQHSHAILPSTLVIAGDARDVTDLVLLTDFPAAPD
jgi:hypothetical protein